MQAVPYCVIVNGTPLTEIVPVRPLEPGFGATVYATDVVPVPLAPAVIVIHGSDAVAVHLHAAAVRTLNVLATGSPALGVPRTVGLTANVHPGALAIVSEIGSSSMTFAARGALAASRPR